MSDRLRWTMTFVVPATFGLATIVLQGASGATLFDDEMGYIGEAVYLSARSGTPYLHGIPFYPAGYATLLAVPLSIVPFDPWVVAVGTNVVLLGAIGPVLHWIVRTATAVSDRTAALAAIAGACVPSVVLQTPRAWSEVAVALGFTVWAALVLRWSRVGPARGAVAVTMAAGVLLSLHRRTVAAVAVTFLAVVVWSLWQGVRPGRGPDAGELGARLRAVPWLPMALALVAGGATVAGALALDGLVADELYGGVTSGNRLRKTENLQSTIWIPALLGHVWSVLATTFGLAGIGLLTLWWYLHRRTHVVFVVVVTLAVGGIVMTSVTFLANGIRADQLVYERYVAPVTPLLVAVGVAALAARLPSWRWATVVSGATMAAIGLVLSISLQESRLTGNVQKFSVPALTSLDVPAVGWAQQYAPRIHAVAITAIALTALVVALAVVRRWTWGAVGVVALWAAVVVVGSAGNLRPFVDVWEPTGREAAAFLDAREVDVVQYAPHTRHESRNVLQYRLGFPDVALIDPSGCPPSPYFVGPPRLEESHDVVPLISVVNFPGVLYERSC